MVIAIAMGIAVVGCGAATKEIARMSQSERTDVFIENPAGGTVPAGFVDMVIKASMKTPLEGYYMLESKESAHGKPDYTFLLNIDEQAVLWQVEGRKHELPEFIDGMTSRDPEAGEGMKYVLEKKVRLAAGAHKLFFGLPGESCYKTAEISVKSGKMHILELKPVYRYKTSPTRISTFLKGISDFEMVLDGQVIP